ncbi:MAG: DUF3341 domain-containing protein [Bacteroidia bacterium]|nr:DUF3341 domain-containing protein [Bacteroidia bacterium]
MSNKIIYGLFDDDERLLNSAKELRRNGVRIKDVFSPFPVHGIDPVIGVPRTRLSIGAFVYGATGLSLGALMLWYMMIHDWPMNIGGKPNFAFYLNLPAFIPPLFEMTVFCAGHGMVITFMLINKLYPGREPHNPDPRTTDDKFMMQINLSDNKVEEEKIKSILQTTGAIEISEK